jgi:HD-GYP domain-containing protein (c-di-GMP phosphodiesterase class II)
MRRLFTCETRGLNHLAPRGLPGACLPTVLALVQMVQRRDSYTGGHCRRVAEYALLLAEELELSAAECRDLHLGALLHDVGKIAIADSLLRKPGRLTDAEFKEMQTHPLKGVAILQAFPDLAPFLPIVRSHHERWDGKGYPDGLAGDEIPFLARVVAVADSFDAMTSVRPYRAGMDAPRALEEISRGAGTQFDPECATAFVRLAALRQAEVEKALHAA